MRHIRLWATLTAGTALAAAAVTPSFADPAKSPRTSAATRPAAAAEATVRLITGDSVTVTKGQDSHQTAAIRPAPDRESIVFHTFEQDGHLTVLPSDAASLVSGGRLDQALFDVTSLVAQGYDTAHTDALPLIVGTSGTTTARTADRLTMFAEQGTPTRELPSIQARSLHVPQDDLSRFWTQLASDEPQLKASAVPRIWLDGRVHAVLDRSTAQIGAPTVWQTGAHGEGVKVAILDTGVDQTHPDLAGRVTETANFSDSASTNDPYGHGTHVASIVGGSGAASDGKRKGVAPKADLLVGKVLGDDGSGSESQIIDGMEWAVAQGARVVSMSLGSDQPSDGSDAMSQAVDELSRTTPALFVVAAGNSGRDGASTIGSPGAADSALTVGAVDRDDSLADFSSRGPRAGDGAVSLIVHGPVHRLTVRTYDEHGARIPAQPLIWGPGGFVTYTDPEHGIAEVEEGTYQVSHTTLSAAEDGQELREVVLPEVKVTKDTTVAVDARKTVPVEIRTPRPAEQRGILSYQTYRELDGHSLVQGTMFFDIAKRLYVSPTAQVHTGTFEFASRWQLVAPLLQARATGQRDPLNAYYMPSSPLFSDRGTTLRAVNAGDAAAPVLTGLRGRLAVLTDEQGTGTDEALRRISAAGAKGVLLIHFDDNPWTRWTPDGDRSPLPVIRVGATTGAKILTRIRHRTTELTFHGTARSPYLYDVMQVARQQVPQHVVHTITARDSAVLHTTYADNGGNGWASEQRFARRPYQQTAWLQYNRYVPIGFTRTEYVSAGDTTWQHLVHHTTVYDPDVPLTLGMRDTPHTYRAGTTAKETWQGSVVRPSIPANTTEPTVRQGNVLRLRIPEFTDSQPGHWSRYLPDDGGIGTSSTEASQDTVTAALYRDGTKLTDLNTTWTDAEIPAAPANYRLELRTSRTSPDWDYATKTATTWSFRSSPADQPTALPLLQLDYAVPVDAHNTVTGTGYYGVIITARAQHGAPTPHHPQMRVEISYDDGRTWHTANTRAHGQDSVRATLNRPHHSGDTAYATVRVTAQDSVGNSVQQTVHRAWAVRD